MHIIHIQEVYEIYLKMGMNTLMLKNLKTQKKYLQSLELGCQTLFIVICLDYNVGLIEKIEFQIISNFMYYQLHPLCFINFMM